MEGGAADAPFPALVTEQDLGFFSFPPSSSQCHQHANNAQENCHGWTSLLSGSGVGFGDPDLQEWSSVNEQVNNNNNINNTGSGNKDKGKLVVGSNRTRRASRPRFAFQTRSPNDILDDGYRWRKYGQKAVKNSMYPRSYYRCTHHTCNVKKQVQRLSKDKSIVVTTYEGMHTHPCEKLMESLSPLLKQMQFFSRIF